MSYNPVPRLENGNAIFNNDIGVSGVSTFNAGVKGSLNTEADGATITFNMDESNTHTTTLGGNRTLAVSNVDAGQKFTLRIAQDSTGEREVNWWSNISWIISGSGEPTLNSGVNEVDYFGFLCTSGGYYDGFHMTELGTGGGGGGGGTTYNIASGLPYSSGDYYLQEIRTNSASGVSISGTLQPQITQNSSDIIVVSGLTSGGSQNLFSTIVAAGNTGGSSQLDVVADTTTDQLTFEAGSNMTITTDSASDKIIFASTGGTTYTAGSGLTLSGTEFNAYGGSGNFEYIELQTDNTVVPKLKFTGSGVTDTPITLEVRSSYESVSESGSALLFQGSQGQLFSITDNLSSGVIFSVADVAGLPMFEIDASGHVHIGEYADDITAYKPILLSGGVPTSTTNKLYNDAGTLYFNGSSLGGGGGLPYTSGDYYLQEIRSNSASGVAISGYFESRADQLDSDVSYVSGISVYASGHTLQTVTDNGATTSNALTVNNTIEADLLLSELDGAIVFECKNSTGAQIDAGTPVYISGYFSANGKPLISPSRSDDATKMPAIGVLESDLADGNEGYVNSFGRVKQIDTSSFTVGNTVYVSPTGGLTNVRPDGVGELVQNMGKVLRSDATQGRILLLGPGRTNDVPNSGSFKALNVDGHFSAVTKSFLIDHPTKDGMKLQYGSLEGPENGVYIRGTSGSNVITLPEYWSTLVDQSTVTVTLTSIGYYQPLFIKEKGKNYIKVGGCKGSYDYVVYGERKDVEKLKVEW